jgi:hypothetical protein
MSLRDALALAALLVAASCGGPGVPEDTSCEDADGDGWCAAVDCDDADPGANPAGVETCDGADDDCDGKVDEQVKNRYYADDDGDGHGDPDDHVQACTCPDGHVETSDDCDDGHSTVWPGAPEICDLLDNDCDGTADEEVQTTFYADDDGDGFGDPGTTSLACSPPPGFVAVAGDCDDADASENPDAEDICGDGKDTDCSGRDARCVFSGSHSLSGADAILRGEASGNWAGNEVAVGDVDGDGNDDLWVGQRESAAGTSGSGEACLIYGPLSGDVSLADADAILVGQGAEYELGRAIAIGDLDGDGLGDVVAGAPHGFPGGAFALFGPVATGTASTARADVRLIGVSEGEDAGHGLAAADFDGDGVDDLAVGAYASSAGVYYGGVVYVQHGPFTSGTRSLAGADAILRGTEAGAGAGEYVFAGDVTGDGLADVLPIASSSSLGSPQAGVVYVVAGPADTDLDLPDADALVVGPAPGAYAGASVAAGDVDGDGNGDLVVGAYGDRTTAKYAGAVYVVLGPLSGDYGLRTDYDVRITGERAGDMAGWSVAAGDVDRDGIDDLAIGAVGESSHGPGSGTVYFLFGPVSGTVGLASADADFYGEGGSDRAGSAVVFGDIDGDGWGDLAIGAEYQTHAGVSGGAAYVVYGESE